MNFLTLSKLMHSGTYQIFAGYIVFALTMLILISKPFTLLYLILMIISLGLISLHHYVAIRVKLDAHLLEFMFNAKSNDELNYFTQELDNSLLSLKLMPIHKMGRSWDIRLQGCQKIFKLQLHLLIFQFVFLTLVAILHLYFS